MKYVRLFIEKFNYEKNFMDKFIWTRINETISQAQISSWIDEGDLLFINVLKEPNHNLTNTN